jgi:cephalosporin hydroxylase
MEHYYQHVGGFFWFAEAYRRLVRALPATQPSAFVEIGALQGRSTCFLGVEILNAGKPCALHVVDPWAFPTPEKGQELYEAFQRHVVAFAPILTVHRMPSVEAAVLFADSSVDVVWIDGDHHYEQVRADILAWWPKLRDGGFMGGDDWNMEPVSRAVIEQFAPNYILGHGWCESPEVTGPWPWWLTRKGALDSIATA